MTLPFNFQVGQMVIPSHLVFEVLAFFLGFRYYSYLKKRVEDPVPEGFRLWLVLGAVVGAAIGSKLLGWLEHPSLWAKTLDQPVLFLVSKTIVGGLLGGLIGVELSKALLGIKTSSGDLFCFPIILGMMLGRIGCFLTGVHDGTHGSETTFFLGMDLGDGKLRHPTALYEIFFLGALWIGLAQLRKRVDLANGALFRIFLAYYLLWRWCVEWIKPVERFSWVGMSAIQLACLLGLVYYRDVFFRFSSSLLARRTEPSQMESETDGV